jgi:transposase-like protein
VSYNERVVNDAIIAALERPGWNQARLARELGEKPQTVNKWVKRQTTPHAEKWHLIEHALGLPERFFWTLVLGPDAIRLQMIEQAKEPDDINPGAARRFDALDARLDRIEAMVEKLVEGAGPARRRAR